MARKRKPSTRIARQAAEIVIAAPQVIAIRTARMALAGAMPSAKDRREFKRMHSEKAAAFSDGWLSMWAQALRVQQNASLAMMSAWWMPGSGKSSLPLARDWSRDALTILEAGIAPVRNRAVANAKRLTGRSR